MPKGKTQPGVHVAGIVDSQQREGERADAEECRGGAEQAIEGLHALAALLHSATGEAAERNPRARS
jgi:hypothetical protein